MKNKLTLKALKQELELLKTSKVSKPSKASKPATNAETHKSTLGHDIKNSYINNLHMKSSALFLYILTGILGYAQKIPFIGRIVSLLSLYYGLTTIWKILVKLRKGFIALNALIGVYIVFKTTGFSYENILAGFSGLGHSYLEILVNFTKRLFNWFFDLFDYKIVPNVPNNPSLPNNKPSILDYKWDFKFPSKDVQEPFFSLRDTYKNVKLTEHTPWYRDWSWSTCLWIGGIACTIGLSYLGYKFITEPGYFAEMFGTSPSITTTAPTPPKPPIVDPGATSSSAIISSDLKGKVADFWTGFRRLTNPYNWFMTSNNNQSTYDYFIGVQTSVDYNKNFYPFTEINPHDPWLKRLRINWLGETSREMTSRLQFRQSILDNIFVPLNKGAITQGPGLLTPILGVESPGWLSIPPSPTVNTVGLNLTSSETLPEFLQGSSRVASKIASVPVTPTHIPVELPAVDSVTTDWGNATKDTSATAYNRLDEWKIARKTSYLPKPGAMFTDETSLAPIIKELTHDNPFSVLESE